MTSTDIDTQIAELITTDQVIERAFGVAHRFETGAASHAGRASYSDCACRYCTVIRQYVRAKIRVKRLQRDMIPYREDCARTYGDHVNRLGVAKIDLSLATAVKAATPLPTFSLIDLLPNQA